MRTLISVLLLTACGPSADDIQRNLKSPNPVVREDSAKIARNVGGDVVVASLVAVLEDDSERVRLYAVDSLAELNDPAALPFLIKALNEDSSPEVRRQVVDALGRLRDPAAVPAIIAYLQDPSHESPPLNAIWALGFIGDLSAMPVLVELRGSDDPYLTWSVDHALRELHP